MRDQFTFTTGKALRAQDALGSPQDFLGSQVCFSVYCATLCFNKAYRRALRALKITYPQYLVLMVLRESDNIAMTEISERLGLESSTLTPMLKRMEERGMVNRKRYAFDERKVIISLTEKGQVLVARAAATVPAAIVRAAGLTAEESSTLRSLLGKLNKSLEASMQEA